MTTEDNSCKAEPVAEEGDGVLDSATAVEDMRQFMRTAPLVTALNLKELIEYGRA